MGWLKKETCFFVLFIGLAPILALATEAEQKCLQSSEDQRLQLCELAAQTEATGLAVKRLLADARFKAGDAVGTLKLYEELAQANPQNQELQYTLGVTYATFNMNLEAIEPLRRAIRLKATDVHAYQVLAIALGFLGRKEEALAATIAAAELGAINEMYDAGMMFLRGYGTPSDTKVGLAWLKQAAEHGHLGATEKLAILYQTGQFGVQRNKALSRAWQKRFAEADIKMDQR